MAKLFPNPIKSIQITNTYWTTYQTFKTIAFENLTSI